MSPQNIPADEQRVIGALGRLSKLIDRAGKDTSRLATMELTAVVVKLKRICESGFTGSQLLALEQCVTAASEKILGGIQPTGKAQ